MVTKATSTQYYLEILDSNPQKSDGTRAAAAQAIACLCCAADRNEEQEAVGLLTALELLLERILGMKYYFIQTGRN